jgi:putative FmdB family regulatory protein
LSGFFSEGAAAGPATPDGTKGASRLPLYEYECTKNGHRFELIRKFSDPPVRTCIHCKSKVKKLISSSAIAFKGSGWYVNDYGRGNNGSRNAQKARSKTDSGSESKTESKSEPKASESSGTGPSGEKSEKGKTKGKSG